MSLSVCQAKVKADRNRQKMAESYSKLSHTQRSEAAQERREQKRRAEKDRLMSEEDPDKQRRLEVHWTSGLQNVITDTENTNSAKENTRLNFITRFLNFVTK